MTRTLLIAIHCVVLALVIAPVKATAQDGATPPTFQGPRGGSLPPIRTETAGTLGLPEAAVVANASAAADVSVGTSTGTAQRHQFDIAAYARVGTLPLNDWLATSVVTENLTETLPAGPAAVLASGTVPELRAQSIGTVGLQFLFGTTDQRPEVMSRLSQEVSFCCSIRNHLAANPPSAFPSECADESSEACLRARVELNNVYTMAEYRACERPVDMTIMRQCSASEWYLARSAFLQGWRGLIGLRGLWALSEGATATSGLVEFGVQHAGADLGGDVAVGFSLGGSLAFLPARDESVGAGVSRHWFDLVRYTATADVFVLFSRRQRLGVYGSVRHAFWSFERTTLPMAQESVSTDGAAGEFGAYVGGMFDVGVGGRFRIAWVTEYGRDFEDGFVTFSFTPLFGAEL